MPNIRPLSAELQKIAIEELNEVPERIPADLEALKAWIQQQPHLKARTDDQFLIAFLRGCKYSLEKTKSKLDRYYTLRSQFRSTFCVQDVDKPRFREVLNLGVCFSLPNPLPNNGPRVALWRNGIYSPSDYTIEEIMVVIHAMQDIIMLEDDYAIINGVGMFMDMANVTAAHMLQMTPREMKRMNVYGLEALPFRPKAQHFMNVPNGFERIFNIFKPMMPEKLLKRLYIHGNNMNSFYAVVPKKCMPIEYGGENGCIQDLILDWNKKFDEYRDYFKDEFNYGTDERLRQGKPIDFDGLFGTDGSFRKLDVD